MDESSDINQTRRDMLITGALTAGAAALPASVSAQVNNQPLVAGDFVL